MCEVDFAFSDNKKSFSGQHVEQTLSNLLKDNFSYMVTESEMDLALGALNAGIIEM